MIMTITRNLPGMDRGVMSPYLPDANANPRGSHSGPNTSAGGLGRTAPQPQRHDRLQCCLLSVAADRRPGNACLHHHYGSCSVSGRATRPGLETLTASSRAACAGDTRASISRRPRSARFCVSLWARIRNRARPRTARRSLRRGRRRPVGHGAWTADPTVEMVVATK